jgi:hypothetical protein
MANGQEIDQTERGQESREGRILCLLLLLGRASGGNDGKLISVKY